jgi:hypothetical protein
MSEESIHPLEQLSLIVGKLRREVTIVSDRAARRLTHVDGSVLTTKEINELKRALAEVSSIEGALVALRITAQKIRRALRRPREEWAAAYVRLRISTERLLQKFGG